MLLAFAGMLLNSSFVFSDTVHLQLRWLHQFQFAGYYAALEKGYYKSAGLEVVIHAGAPGKQPVKQVMKGSAQYGVANSELLLERLNAAPLIALASIYQHSPSILLTRKDAHILSPHDLVGKEIMMIGNSVDADFITMFKNEGIDLNSIKIIPSSYNVQDLIDGKVVAFNSYLCNEPYFLKSQGIDYSILHPRHYGVDFYSDILFTTEQEIDRHPERVKAFLKASLQGWHYALQNPDEIIDLLIEKYQVKKSRTHLVYEAETIRKLILPDLIEIGHMNPWRWKHMAETFVESDMANDTSRLKGFVYQLNNSEERKQLKRYLRMVLFFLVITSLIIIIIAFAYRRTQREIKLRIKAEQELTKLAYSDSLTGMGNRHHFFILANQAIKQAIRDKYKLIVIYIDLNDFKVINDQYGHAAGDQVLVHVSKVMLQHIRNTDIAARMGGDEFVLLFNQVVDDLPLFDLIKTINKEISQPILYNNKSINVTASIGLSVFPDDGEDIDKLLEKADTQMFKHKFESKNA